MPNQFGETDYPPADYRREANAIARAQAIVHCGLCDDNGYRGATVCDHVDRAAIAARGMAMVRRAMGWEKP